MCRFIASILLYGEENEPENGRYRVARGDGDVEEEVPITVFSSFSFHTNGLIMEAVPVVCVEIPIVLCL